MRRTHRATKGRTSSQEAWVSGRHAPADNSEWVLATYNENSPSRLAADGVSNSFAIWTEITYDLLEVDTNVPGGAVPPLASLLDLIRKATDLPQRGAKGARKT